jgi:hypothetical protein
LPFCEFDASRLDGGNDRDFQLALGAPDRDGQNPVRFVMSA